MCGQYIILSFCIFITLFSCHFDNPIRKVLTYSAGNQQELEKVIRHFSEKASDSLKLKAAYFLISNMPGHYSYVSDSLNIYHQKLYQLTLSPHLRERRSKALQLAAHYKNTFSLKEDCRIITSDFLIRNIEEAFKAWEAPWARHVNFEDFCEYILPYKTSEKQILTEWRDSLRNRFNTTLLSNRDCDQFYNSAYWNCTFVNQDMVKELRYVNEKSSHREIQALSLPLRIHFLSGNCMDRGEISIAAMRSKGIPVCIDYTPQWPFRANSHSWCVVLANNGKNMVYEGIGTPPGVPHKPDEKMAKVFRLTYARNPQLEQLNAREKEVPAFFRNIFQKDVTEEYMATTNVTIPVNPSPYTNNQYVYLAVFDNEKWVPVQWAEIRKGKATFPHMGRDIVYLPVYCTSFGTIPAGPAFLLNSQGEIKLLEAKTTKTQEIRLTRKYPVLHNKAFKMMKRMKNARIEGSNNPAFQPATPIASVSCTPFEEIHPDTCLYFRYWRYISSPDGFCNIAELSFYGIGDNVPKTGKIIGTQGTLNRNNPAYMKEVVNDHNILTFFDAPVSDSCWVGYDFGVPVNISLIRCIARGDGNNIQPGNQYELFYWNKNRWESLGEKKAGDFFIIYEQVPRNALLWLRNLSEGKEERIFLWENNRPVWY